MTGEISEVGEELYYKDELGRHFHVIYHNHRLVKRPGYETIIYNVDEAYFTKQGELVFLHVSRGDQSYKYLVGECYKQKPKEEDSDEDHSES